MDQSLKFTLKLLNLQQLHCHENKINMIMRCFRPTPTSPTFPTSDRKSAKMIKKIFRQLPLCLSCRRRGICSVLQKVRQAMAYWRAHLLAEQAVRVQFPPWAKTKCNIQMIFSRHKVVGKMKPDPMICVI